MVEIVGIALMKTVKAHCAQFPEASQAEQLTVLVPTAKVDPLGGVEVTLTLEQVSEAVTLNVTLLLVNWPGSALAVRLGGHVSVGAWVSPSVSDATLEVTTQPAPVTRQR